MPLTQEMQEGIIDVSDIPPHKLLCGLYNASIPQGMGLLHFTPGLLDEGEARAMIEEQQTRFPQLKPYFDYLKGRVMKVEINGSMLDARLYDRDNGPGAAKRVVDRLRAKPAEANAMTDEERLGLPEEPEAYAKIEPLRAWGAAWRKKALELEKTVKQLEVAWSTESSKCAAAMADAAMANKARDEWQDTARRLIKERDELRARFADLEAWLREEIADATQEANAYGRAQRFYDLAVEEEAIDCLSSALKKLQGKDPDDE